MQTFTELDYRRACSSFATGITIVTTADRQGDPVGITVNSFSSVSLDPPLVLWSIGPHSRSFEAFVNCSHYAVHVMHRGQMPLVSRFARSGEDKFAGLPWHSGEFGSPILPDYAVCMQCRLVEVHPVGHQRLLIGQVLTLEDRGHEDATLFFRGRYHQLD